MARTNISPVSLPSKYPATPLAADAADLTFTQADDVNGNEFSGVRALILAWNKHATIAQTVGIPSVIDEKNRKGDITAYSIGPGEIAAFQVDIPGWMQIDGKIQLDASTTDIWFAVIPLD